MQNCQLNEYKKYSRVAEGEGLGILGFWAHESLDFENGTTIVKKSEKFGVQEICATFSYIFNLF